MKLSSGLLKEIDFRPAKDFCVFVLDVIHKFARAVGVVFRLLLDLNELFELVSLKNIKFLLNL